MQRNRKCPPAVDGHIIAISSRDLFCLAEEEAGDIHNDPTIPSRANGIEQIFERRRTAAPDCAPVLQAPRTRRNEPFVSDSRVARNAHEERERTADVETGYREKSCESRNAQVERNDPGGDDERAMRMRWKTLSVDRRRQPRRFLEEAAESAWKIAELAESKTERGNLWRSVAYTVY